MRLNLNGLADPAYKAKGYVMPTYDIAAMRKRTIQTPAWLHFGAGNIFRAFPAAGLDSMLSKGSYDRGVIVCESFDEEILTRAYHPFDALSLLVTLKADGNVQKKVVASVAAAYSADPNHADQAALLAAFTAPSLQICSFTVTEKGYALYDTDFAAPQSAMSRVAKLLYQRYQAGATPLTLLSMDNCSHNGDKLKAAIGDIAAQWAQRGLVDAGFLDYIDARISYPWSMIDKITPRPDERIAALLQADGFLDTELIRTKRNTFTAAFCNAEETEYLIIEDAFINGRPPLEDAGFLFTDRETVDKVERMKVCTCLNPVHTALAIFGCLLGYTLISEEMKDEDLRLFVTQMAYKEALPVVTSPGILNPEAFLNTVLTVRLPNPFMPDAPQRIATDTSQKLPIRFGETIKHYMADPNLSAASLTFIPLVIAGWLRYLMGLDDRMKPFEPSPDPLLETLLPLVRAGDFEAILDNDVLFGVSLEKAGLKARILSNLKAMQAGEGAVRRTIRAAL